MPKSHFLLEVRERSGPRQSGPFLNIGTESGSESGSVRTGVMLGQGEGQGKFRKNSESPQPCRGYLRHILQELRCGNSAVLDPFTIPTAAGSSAYHGPGSSGIPNYSGFGDSE